MSVLLDHPVLFTCIKFYMDKYGRYCKQLVFNRSQPFFSEEQDKEFPVEELVGTPQKDVLNTVLFLTLVKRKGPGQVVGITLGKGSKIKLIIFAELSAK